MAEPQQVRLTLSPEAKRYAGPDAPVEARRLAARGALPFPPIELATVLFALLHDSDAEVKTRAQQSLEELPPHVCTSVLSGAAHPAVLSYLAQVHKDAPQLMEQVALNAGADDETFVFLAGLPHKRVVEIVANNQQRMLRCPEIVDALGANRLTGRAVIHRILSFLGFSRPAAEVLDEADEMDLPESEEITDQAAEAALRALLGDDMTSFSRALVEDTDRRLGDEERANLFAQIQQMNVMQKIKLARMGNQEARGLLVRDHNKIVATAAIRSPKLSENEVTQFAKLRSISDEVLRAIASNREWTRSYQIKLALATNPKCPQPTAMKFLNYLQDRDLMLVMRSRDVPSVISTHARRILMKKGKV